MTLRFKVGIDSPTHFNETISFGGKLRIRLGYSTGVSTGNRQQVWPIYHSRYGISRRVAECSKSSQCCMYPVLAL